MKFSERLELIPDWCLGEMYKRYSEKPFSYKNRAILWLIHAEQRVRSENGMD